MHRSIVQTQRLQSIHQRAGLSYDDGPAFLALRYRFKTANHKTRSTGMRQPRSAANGRKGWAVHWAGGDLAGTAVNTSQTSHSLQLATTTEMRDEATFRCASSKRRCRLSAVKWLLGYGVPRDSGQQTYPSIPRSWESICNYWQMKTSSLHASTGYMRKAYISDRDQPAPGACHILN